MRTPEEVEKVAAQAVADIARSFANAGTEHRFEYRQLLSAQDFLQARDLRRYFDDALDRMLHVVGSKAFQSKQTLGAPVFVVQIVRKKEDPLAWGHDGDVVISLEIPTASNEQAALEALTRALFDAIYRGKLEDANKALIKHGHKGALQELRPSPINWNERF